tara:strand:+ start:6717 stop:7658 length:942 start_codon:yes stop_codon:yes gene_type:complete
MKNKICELFSIKYPIIQAGMVWCSGWKLASEVSNNGGLGIIGSGSMRPDLLKHHIMQCKLATKKNFAVNVPLLYPYTVEHMKIIIDEKVPIVFTSAGSPDSWTNKLKENNIKVVHVVSNLKFAIKAINAGVDAIVCEGFEAGGHNGRDETTTFCLIPHIKKNTDIPLIAAGGIYSGKSMLAAMILGADGVQIGSRFVMSEESSAHENFKKKISSLKNGDTILTLKEITPVRMVKNQFYLQIQEAYKKGSSIDELRKILGKGRARLGMFCGDLKKGELEIGQVSCMLDSIQPAKEIINEIVEEFEQARSQITKL